MSGVPFASGVRLPLRAACCPDEQHAVMHDAEYFGHAVRRHPVDHQMPGLTDPMLARHEATHGPEMERSDSRDFGNIARAGHRR